MTKAQFITLYLATLANNIPAARANAMAELAWADFALRVEANLQNGELLQKIADAANQGRVPR